MTDLERRIRIAEKRSAENARERLNRADELLEIGSYAEYRRERDWRIVKGTLWGLVFTGCIGLLLYWFSGGL